ncbi:MAG: C40 family peptidase [Lachnospiraceae bacterium]|nr:C40 family peptidase [Lachnospiraceae bacterium]
MIQTHFRMKHLVALILSAGIVLASFDSISYAAKSVREIEKDMSDLQKEINALDSELVSLLTEIDVLETDIANCEAELEDLAVELAAAQESEEKQYQAMKLRMKYMYERGEQSLLTILLESGSLSDFINRVEYANSVYEYDRNLLETFRATQIEIENMQSEIETQKASLESQKASLAAKRTSLDSMIAAKENQMDDFAVQLEKAKEEARRKAAEEAARKAAEEARRNAAMVTPSSGSSEFNEDNTDTGVVDANPSPVTNVSGSSVVAYAQQFVGNPYVWGGNSLTEGCDCSGFVVEVYKHFGINLSGSRNSGALRSVGQAVSYNNIQAGDIVCYSGHVGIYAGGGVIVEAQSTRAGITANRSVTCRKILAIRRVV